MIKKWNLAGPIMLASFLGVLFMFAGCDKIDGARVPTAPDENPPSVEENLAPVINCINCTSFKVKPNAVIKVDVNACDPEEDELAYVFYAQKGILVPNGCSAKWTLPSKEGDYTLNVKVSDGKNIVSSHIDVEVVNFRN